MNLGNMQEQCTRCCAELELGQIGLCDSCQDSDSVTPDYNLAQYQAFYQELTQELGFGTDQDINGGDTVDSIQQALPVLAGLANKLPVLLQAVEQLDTLSRLAAVNPNELWASHPEVLKALAICKQFEAV